MTAVETEAWTEGMSYVSAMAHALEEELPWEVVVDVGKQHHRHYRYHHLEEVLQYELREGFGIAAGSIAAGSIAAGGIAAGGIAVGGIAAGGIAAGGI